MTGGVQCTACPRKVAVSWAFSAGDLFCPLCGLQTLHLRPNGGVVSVRRDNRGEESKGEIWLYLKPDRTAALRMKMLRWAVPSEVLPEGGTRQSGDDFIEWGRARAAFRLPNGTQHDFAIRRDKATGNVLLEAPSALAVDKIPVVGWVGAMRLPGLPPGDWHARLFIEPRTWLQIRSVDVPPEVPYPPGTRARLIGLLDPATKDIRVSVRVQSPEAPVVVERAGFEPKSAKLLKDLGIEEHDTDPHWQPGKPMAILVPGQKPQIFTFILRGPREPLEPVPVDLVFLMRSGEKVPFPATLEFRHKPTVRLFHERSAAEEFRFALGGAANNFNLYVLSEEKENALVPLLDVAHGIKIEPPEHAAWLSVNTLLDTVISNDADRPTRVPMKADTRLLSRQPGEFADRTHEISVVIRDVREFELARHKFRVSFPRMPQMEGVLGFDWGTTNNCAATGDVGTIASLPLDEKDPTELERFSSALFVKEIRADGTPVLAVGTEAHELIDVSENRECVVRGLKRAFLKGGTMRLRDPRGQQVDLPVEQVTRLYLGRMIEYLEQRLEREIGFFGLTYPTKWSAPTRERLAQTLEAVRADLAAMRPGRVIDLVPPVLDEATAVALCKIRELARHESPDRPPRLVPGQKVLVVAYDFGGGTTDTVVIRVDMSSDEDLHTSLVGIGGRPDFGGDDITRAILWILRDRITKTLQSYQTGCEFLVLLPDEPDRGENGREWNRAARQNAEYLWKRAEEIKRGLCRNPAAGTQDDPVSAALEPVVLQDLKCYSPTGSGEPDPEEIVIVSPFLSLDAALQTGGKDRREDFRQRVHFGLPQVYAAPLDARGTTIEQRLTETILQIKGLLDEAGGSEPRIIVLAGGACRLPLVGKLAHEHLIRNDADELDYRENFAKQRVAHGNAWHLMFRYAGGEGSFALVPPSEVTHRPLVFCRITIRGEDYPVVVPVGAHLHAPSVWFPAQVNFDPRRPALLLWAKDWRGDRFVPVRVGEFERTPADALLGDNDLVREALPADLKGNLPVAVRLVRMKSSGGMAQRIDLRVQVSGPDGPRWFGPYSLRPLGSGRAIDDLLQGVMDE